MRGAEVEPETAAEAMEMSIAPAELKVDVSAAIPGPTHHSTTNAAVEDEDESSPMEDEPSDVLFPLDTASTDDPMNTAVHEAGAIVRMHTCTCVQLVAATDWYVLFKRSALCSSSNVPVASGIIRIFVTPHMV